MQREKIELLVVGAGGFGREVIWQMEQSDEMREQYTILGFVDDNLNGNKINGYHVVGDLAWLLERTQKTAVVIAIGNVHVREQIVNRLLKNENLIFPSFVANNIVISDSVSLGKGCIVCLGTILTVNIQCGDFCILNLSCTVGHDAVIENFVTLYPGVNVSGNVIIKESTEIGTGTKIIQGKVIGSNSIIGAGTVIIKDIPSGVTAVGNPARIVKSV